jgi:thiol-disulfide isomerase/thioredoxin
MVVFLAHWCPHCNAEIPVLLEWQEAGRIPDDLAIVGVSTGVNEAAPNYPPDEWLTDMGWPWPVLADSPPTNESAGTAADAYGVNAYPFFTIVDDDGTVLLRGSGEKSLDELDALVSEALGT